MFARELGVAVPDSIQDHVLEETPATVWLVLPQVVAAAGSELSDAEIEAVAGRRLEIAHLNGAAVRLGRALGIRFCCG